MSLIALFTRGQICSNRAQRNSTPDVTLQFQFKEEASGRSLSLPHMMISTYLFLQSALQSFINVLGEEIVQPTGRITKNAVFRGVFNALRITFKATSMVTSGCSNLAPP